MRRPPPSSASSGWRLPAYEITQCVFTLPSQIGVGRTVFTMNPQCWQLCPVCWLASRVAQAVGCFGAEGWIREATCHIV
jgi:hypothetical protein